MSREIKYLVVHCTGSGKNTTIKSIQNYWKNNLGWKSSGYHYIIESNGNVVQLSDESKITNGVAGYNSVSIHISYIGGQFTDDRTPEQKESIEKLLKELKKKYPKAKIQGHRDFPNVKKACPQFNTIEEYKHIK